jgi:hypothetical protein
LDNAFDCFSPLTRYSRCRQGDQMSLWKKSPKM